MHRNISLLNNMLTKIRYALEESGCADQRFINRMESRWLRLNANKRTLWPWCLEYVVKKNPRNLSVVSRYVSRRICPDKRIATEIARSFCGKATLQINMSKSLSLGVTRAKWAYVEGVASRCPHKSIDGTEFDLSKGLLFRGNYIHPNLEPGCMCMYRPIVPGWDG